jgi:acetyl coenzyme A synthetase (ADP forming)-like protein
MNLSPTHGGDHHPVPHVKPNGGHDMSRWIDAFFAPTAVAVVGASRDPAKVGGSVLANLRSAGFEGRIVPVNAEAPIVQGLAAVPSIAALDGPIDLAVLAIPAPEVLPALQACVAEGIPGAVVISAGFRESGPAGREREEALRGWLAGQPIRVLGPNCLGWIRPARKLNLTFAPGMPLPGPIAFVSHSGALAVAILDWSRERRMGFSLFASLGNQADLTETDVFRAVIDDDETRVVAAYLEGVADGAAFVEALGALAAVKPVVVLKAGRSPEGARAVSSHTGALAGSDVAFDAAVHRAGAVRARSIEELFDLVRALAAQPLPRGRRLTIVTNGGGLGIVAADAARDAGLEVTPPPDAVRARLRAVLPPMATVGNPIDLVGDADAGRFADALHALGPDHGADALLVLLTAQAATDAQTVARAIVASTRGWPLAIAAAFVGGARVAGGARTLDEAGVPCYAFPEHAVAALGGLTLVAARRRARSSIARTAPPPPEALAVLAGLRAAGHLRLGMLDLAPALAACGIALAAPVAVKTADEAGAAATRVGFPVALKIVSPDISHKTEVGGVRLGLTSADAVVEAARGMRERAARERPQAVLAGFSVQPMVPPGKELLLGTVRDAHFGPLVMVGFGGVYVEVFRDTAVRLAPVGPDEALAMLDDLRLAPLLHGVRGEPPVDLMALATTIARFSELAAATPGLEEMELNPLVAGPAGVIVVDARATLAPPSDRARR